MFCVIPTILVTRILNSREKKKRKNKKIKKIISFCTSLLIVNPNLLFLMSNRFKLDKLPN